MFVNILKFNLIWKFLKVAKLFCVHEVVWSSPLKMYNYECSNCDQKFSQMQEFLRHMQDGCRFASINLAKIDNSQGEISNEASKCCELGVKKGISGWSCRHYNNKHGGSLRIKLGQF